MSILLLLPNAALYGQMRANEPGGELAPPPGMNLSLTETIQHDSANGWNSLLTPEVLWRFNSRFSLDMTLPVFNYITTEVNKGTRRLPKFEPETKHHAVGDLLANATYERRSGSFDYTVTATVGLPTGKSSYGLGAGKVTYGLSNRLGYSFDWLTPDVELALGNSSNVVGTGPTLPYIANATFAYFQAGATAEVTDRIDFRAEMFEMLPLSEATIYSTTSRGRLAVNDDEEEDASGEDNGLNASLTIPVASHWAVTGFYTHSLINHYDIGGVSLTYSFRPHARKTRF